MRIRLAHETRYHYDTPPKGVIQTLRLTPRNFEGQRVRTWRVELDQDVQVHNGEDAFGNILSTMSFTRPLDDLTVTVRGEVETHETHGIVAGALERFPPGLYLRETPLTQPDADISAFAIKTAGNGDPLDKLHKLMAALHEELTFVPGVTDAATTAAKAFALKKGVCQDFTHLMIAVLRSFGVPARYVSGYIHRPNKESQSHAWCEVWLPDVGWTGFDPTNGCPVNHDFVKTAVGRDFSDVPPNKGIYRGAGEERIDVRVATRTLDRLPSLSWHDQLAPLDVPVHSVLRTAPVYGDDVDVQQQ